MMMTNSTYLVNSDHQYYGSSYRIFPPLDKRYFDEEMSGRFFGIGAQLQYDEGNIKISSIVAGTPALEVE